MSRSAAIAVATAAAAAALAAALYLRHRRRKPSPAAPSSWAGSLPDCICDVCMAEIGSDQPRYRCAAPSYDNFHACAACATQPQLVAAHCPHRLFRERRSAYASILAVHDGRPGFTDAPLAAGAPPPPTTAALLTRALDAFAEQPCLGEVDVAGAAVLWTSYTEVWAAAERMARVLHLGCAGAGVVAIWAPNGRAWIVGDLACVLAGLPSACVDANLVRARVRVRVRIRVAVRLRSLTVTLILTLTLTLIRPPPPPPPPPRAQPTPSGGASRAPSCPPAPRAPSPPPPRSRPSSQSTRTPPHRPTRRCCRARAPPPPPSRSASPYRTRWRPG